MNQDSPISRRELTGGLFGAVKTESHGKVSFTDCHFHNIDPRNKVRTLIDAPAGRLQIRGCHYIDGHAPRDYIVLGKDIYSAIVADNTIQENSVLRHFQWVDGN